MAFRLSIVSAMLALSLSSCASIVSGTQQGMFVDTPDVVGASCKLHDSKAGSWYLKDTPDTVTVQKGNGPMNIVCTKEGYDTATVSVDESVAGSTFGNIILGGGIGIFVDAATGAAQKYPDKVVVWMKPQKFKTLTEEKEWHDKKVEFERKMAEEVAAKKKTQESKLN